MIAKLDTLQKSAQQYDRQNSQLKERLDICDKSIKEMTSKYGDAKSELLSWMDCVDLETMLSSVLTAESIDFSMLTKLECIKTDFLESFSSSSNSKIEASNLDSRCKELEMKTLCLLRRYENYCERSNQTLLSLNEKIKILETKK